MDDNRENLPLNGPGRYKVTGGRVFTRSIEVNAVDHCNLSCRGCSHGSPLAEKSCMSPQTVYEDLVALSRVIGVENVRVVGGEPLLHDDLAAFLTAIRDSGIAGHITLVTNGLLMEQADPAIWDLVGKVEVSLYPLSARMTDRVRKAVSRITERGVPVDILEYSNFREAMALNESKDGRLVRAIYDTCQIAHFWRCITVDRGWVFRCPQSLYRSRASAGEFLADARRIESLADTDSVLAFLENPDPLAACWSCAGSVGSAFPHQQVSRRAWIGSIGTRPEDVVDEDHLAKLMLSPRTSSNCMNRIRFNH